MRLILLFLFGLFSCNTRQTVQFSTLKIHNNVLIEKITQFITVNSQVGTGSDIIISSHKAADTSIFYLIGDRKPNFKKNRILGCTYINKVLVWLQGEEPDGHFISINKSYSDKQFEVDMVKEGDEIFLGHPLQWTIEFKGNTFVSCKSNNGKNCE